jgi:lipopolysaccharide export system ATP-binding protein
MGGCLRAIQLTKHFGRRQVVKGVDILVEPGEIVALLGRNGAGKSTTFQMIAGQTSPDSGDIQLDDRSILRLPAYARSRLGLTYLPQERSVFLKLSVSENIGVPLEQRGFSKRDGLRRTEELLTEFGLTYAARMGAYALSGGESRKLEVARALATDPHFILLDEPFAGMDPIHVREVQDVILRLRTQGLGVLISDHNVYYAFEIIDRGYVIDDGRVIVMGSSGVLAMSPLARSAFLGDDFRVPPAIGENRGER